MTTAFWAEESMLSEPSGIARFSAPHILTLCVLAVGIAAIVCVHIRGGDRRKRKMELAAAWFLPCAELFKTAVLLAGRKYGIGYLPLHFCSLAVYLFPIYTVCRSEKLRQRIAAFSETALLPAAVITLLSPDWLAYPSFNFFSLHSYIWHAVQVAFPLMLLCGCRIVPDLNDLRDNTAVALVLAGVIWGFDALTGCNYWFLRAPAGGTFLETIYAFSGSAGYVLSLVLITFSVMAATTLLLRLLFRNSADASI